MYKLLATDGAVVTKCEHFEIALSLLRSVPRAAEVRCDESGVLLAWKARNNLLALVGYGEHAGAPRGAEQAWVN